MAPSLGGHDLAFVGEASGRRWVCRVCHRSSSQRLPFATRPCTGSAALRWAQQASAAAGAGTAYGVGHTLLLSDTITWCFRCGAYACAQARLLQQPCPGNVRASQWRRHARQRLLLGLHPDKRTPLARDAVPEPGAELPEGFASAVRAAERSQTTVALSTAQAGSRHAPTHGRIRRQRLPTPPPVAAAQSEPAWKVAMLARMAEKRRLPCSPVEPPPAAQRRRRWKQPE